MTEKVLEATLIFKTNALIRLGFTKRQNATFLITCSTKIHDLENPRSNPLNNNLLKWNLWISSRYKYRNDKGRV